MQILIYIASMLLKIKQHWFLAALVSVFCLVVFDGTDIIARAGIFLKNNKAPSFIIFIVFIVSGLLLEHDQIKSGLKDIKATCIALSVIIIIAPAAACLFLYLPMDTGVMVGFFLVAVMPTTLSSGIVMTGTAGGNMAHALFVTVLSNFVCIFSIPMILGVLLVLLDQQANLAIDQTAIIVKLINLVLLPLSIGMFLKAKLFSKTYLSKPKLQLINQWFIVCMVFLAVCGAKDLLVGKWSLFFIIVFIAFVYHLILLLASISLVKLFKLEKGRYESVIFMGSQKTLVLAVMIQMTYFTEFGTALVVCVVHHIVHLMMDGYLAAKLSRRNLSENG